jgi:tetratricopeptide (TPR) repeat protein
VASHPDDPCVGDDARVRGALERELGRLNGADPMAVLGLAPGASVNEVRGRFLELVKRYHPTRYARRPRDVVRLANEVFFRLKAAYEAAAEKPSPRAARQTADRLERLSSASQPRLEVDAALARRRRLRSYPVLPATPAPSETVTPGELADRVRRSDEERKQRIDAAVADLRAGRLEKAREAFRALVAETPADKQVRVLLHYALGREHHAAGRTESARGEYERALATDPRFEPAQKSLALLGPEPDRVREEERGGGLISRWFRR